MMGNSVVYALYIYQASLFNLLIYLSVGFDCLVRYNCYVFKCLVLGWIVLIVVYDF